MKKIFEISKAMNNAFIKVILFIFYYTVIGIISLFYHLFQAKRKKTNSYWEDVADVRPDKDYFSSSY